VRLALAIVCAIVAAAGAAMAGARQPGLTPATAFAPSPAGRASTLRIEGRLSLRPLARPDGMTVLKDTFPETPDHRGRWPDLDLDLVSDGADVIPARGGPIAPGSSEWSWVVSPGIAWSEPEDKGGARVLFPVALEEANANCLHNGRLLVLLDRSGAAVGARAQFDAERCAYFHFDAWSRVPVTFTPGPVEGAAEVVARYREEIASRPATASLAALSAAYPGIDLAALARAAGPDAVWGLDDGRTDFVAPCPGRAGPDPLCGGRALPSYSTAKTLVGAQGLMRLEALAPGAAQERVAAHVPACAAAGGWEDVRLIDLLDMTSGHYRLAGPEADEDSPAMGAFFAAPGAEQRLAFACGQPREAAPGVHFAYHTADSFLLGAAMTDVLRRRGLGRDVYDDLIAPIWAAIGQSSMLDATRRTGDSEALPFTGYGLAYTRDDVVRAARFLSRGGEAGGRPWLDRTLLDEALQRSPAGSGAGVFPHIIYRHGVWARDVGPLIGCARPVWAPFMSGYGGISVVMFPNDVRFWSFNDDGHFDWGEAARQVNRIRPLCP
jgi:hypothetical protein